MAVIVDESIRNNGKLFNFFKYFVLRVIHYSSIVCVNIIVVDISLIYTLLIKIIIPLATITTKYTRSFLGLTWRVRARSRRERISTRLLLLFFLFLQASKSLFVFNIE